jgi:hypothetical protein
VGIGWHVETDMASPPSGEGKMSERGDGGLAQECSLRDYFAGQALITCLQTVVQIECVGGALKKDAPITAAEMAYQIADAMLEARK